MVVVQQAQELQWPTSWEEAEDFARRLTDALGCTIDDGIVETVVALNLLGFRTSQSCEGHLDEGLAYPWIDFQTGECPAWYEQAQEDAGREGQSPEEEEAALASLMARVSAYHHEDHPYTRLLSLLDAFYEARTDDDEEWRLIVHCMHPGYYRMCSACGYEANTWSEDTRAHFLLHAQVEMQAFTVFLKHLWQRKQDVFQTEAHTLSRW